MQNGNLKFTHFIYKPRKVWVNEKVDRIKVKGKAARKKDREN